MVINIDKTKIMKFRRGFKITDTFLYAAQQIEVSNSATYVGLTLQTTGTTFTQPIERRLSQVQLEMYKMKEIYSITKHSTTAFCT